MSDVGLTNACLFFQCTPMGWVRIAKQSRKSMQGRKHRLEEGNGALDTFTSCVSRVQIIASPTFDDCALTGICLFVQRAGD